MERFMSKPPEEREKILSTIFGTGKEKVVGTLILKAIKSIEKEGGKATLKRMRHELGLGGGRPIYGYLPKLLDLGVIEVKYSEPSRIGQMKPYYTFNKEYDWIIQLIE